MHVIKIIVDFDIINHLVGCTVAGGGAAAAADPGRVYFFSRPFRDLFYAVSRRIFYTISECTNISVSKMQLHFILYCPEIVFTINQYLKLYINIYPYQNESQQQKEIETERNYMCRNVVYRFVLFELLFFSQPISSTKCMPFFLLDFNCKQTNRMINDTYKNGTIKNQMVLIQCTALSINMYMHMQSKQGTIFKIIKFRKTRAQQCFDHINIIIFY